MDIGSLDESMEIKYESPPSPHSPLGDHLHNVLGVFPSLFLYSYIYK